MIRHRKIFLVALLAGAAALLAPSTARAQFVGDVFFAQPSQAVPEGGTAVFEVLLFSGAQVVGATHFDVVFDPALAEVVGVEAGTTEQLAPGHVAVTSPGRAAVVDLNSQSLTRPIGTSSLARIEVRPLAPAGTRVPLAIQVRSLLRHDSTAFSGRGFGGEILVVSPPKGGGQSAAAATAAGAAEPVDPERAARAWEVRRPGQAVDLYELRSRGGEVSAVPRRVVVPDPAAPSEAPPPGE